MDTENSSSFNGNENKNMRAEQICILHSLEVLSFGSNPASRVNSKTLVRLIYRSQKQFPVLKVSGQVSSHSRGFPITREQLYVMGF